MESLSSLSVSKSAEDENNILEKQEVVKSIIKKTKQIVNTDNFNGYVSPIVLDAIENVEASQSLLKKTKSFFKQVPVVLIMALKTTNTFNEVFLDILRLSLMGSKSIMKTKDKNIFSFMCILLAKYLVIIKNRSFYNDYLAIKQYYMLFSTDFTSLVKLAKYLEPKGGINTITDLYNEIIKIFKNYSKVGQMYTKGRKVLEGIDFLIKKKGILKNEHDDNSSKTKKELGNVVKFVLKDDEVLNVAYNRIKGTLNDKFYKNKEKILNKVTNKEDHTEQNIKQLFEKVIKSNKSFLQHYVKNDNDIKNIFVKELLNSKYIHEVAKMKKFKKN